MKKNKLKLKSPKLRAKLVRELDGLWSLRVKERDGHKCRICGSDKNVLHSHHIFAKRECGAVRWHVLNGVTVCWYCHKFRVHTNPEKYRPQITSHLSEQEFENLREDALEVKKYTLEEMNEIMKGLI